MAESALAEVFIAAFPEPRQAQFVGQEQLEAALLRVLGEGRLAYPEISLDGSSFASGLGRSLCDADDPVARLDAIRAADMYLARACALGDRQALAIFEREHLQHVADFVARVERESWFVDEVKQKLRERLFVGEAGGEPKIGEYRGDGALGGWVRVAAVRIALNLKRGDSRRREDPIGATESSEQALSDAEVPHLRRLLGGDFRHALEATLAALPAEERMVLRMHYLDGLSIDDLAKLHRVHRSTVARWLERARSRILDDTRARLRDRLGPKESVDIDSIVRLVQSELDVSVARFLRETSGSS